MNKYILIILAPTGEEKRFESSTPFMPVAKGDTIDFTLFQDAEGLNLPLRVAEVQHTVWQTPGHNEPTQMVSVITQQYSLD